MLLGAAALIAAGLLLPFAVNVNRFRGQIVGALEAGLGRPVQAGNIRLKLLAWPGFDLENVSIGEDPAFGNEPFARMPVLRARLRLRSLWTGRMVFSSLVFVEPSVNLARNAEGRWAIERLLARAAAASRSLAARPYVELRDARINFKAGDFKSVFFLSDVDAALYPAPGAPPRLLLRLSCSPARTDRTLTDLGQWRVEGSFQPAAATRSDVRLQLSLSDTYLGDLQVLASGRDYGIHGLLNARATLEGEAAALRLKGAARLADLHRWDLLPPPGNPAVDLDFEALLDAPAGRLQLLRLQTPLGAGKLEATGAVTNLWERPQCDLRTAFSGARAATVLAAMQHFSTRLSRAAPLDGLLEGELRVRSMPPAVDGFLRGRRLEMRDAAAPEARVEFHGTRAVLLPAVVKWEPRGSITLAGDWNWAGGVGRLAATGGDVPFRSLSGLAALAGLDLAESTRLQPEGRVSLNLRAEGIGSAPKLAGWVQLTRVPWTPSASGSPVMIHTARLEMTGEQVRATRIVAAWAGATITGALRFPWRLPGVLRADLRADEVSSGALSGALRPGRLGLLPELREPAAAAQTSSRRPPAPPAQPRLRIEGRLAIDRLRLRRLTMQEVIADFRIAGQRVFLNPARARLADGAWTGDATLDLSGGAPAIQVHGQVRQAALGELAALSPQLEGLAAGRVSGSLVASASGWELPEALDSLSMRLKLEGEQVLLHNVDFDTAAGATTAAADRLGSFQADLAVERRRVRLQKMVWHSPSSEYSVAGAVSFDRLLDVQVTPLKPPSLNPFRLTGPLEAPVVEPLPAPRRPD
jgi:hypothetical protein